MQLSVDSNSDEVEKGKRKNTAYLKMLYFQI